MRSFILSLFAITLALNISAQECATDLLPQVKIMGLNRSDVNLADVEVATLPVVFHIMHLGEPIGESFNVSDEQVLEALVESNNHFRKVSGSTGDGIGVDTKIDFCLAQRDPNGNPTTGIVRYDLSGYPAYVNNGVAVSGLDDGMPDLQLKSLGCWDVDRYVNVYIVTQINGSNGINGYAYPGPTNNCLDGVVLRYSKFVITDSNLGKTFTHELGHYLNLQHTFLNTFDCGSEGNCETQGDMVCDTPPTITNVSCVSPACPGAMVENYMDYTGQVCRDSYTQGQAERMHACIVNERADLIDNLNCVPPVDFDAGLANLVYKPEFCLENQDVSVNVIGTALNTMPAATVVLTANGVSYEQWVYDVEYGGSYEVVFEGVPVQGDFDVVLVSESDQYAGNDSLSGNVAYSPGALWEMDFTSGFFASETNWVLVGQDSKDVIIGDGPWSAGITTRSYETCLSSGCYNFIIEDAGGDGIQYGGEVDMFLNGELIGVDVSGDDWSQLVFDFCVDGVENDCIADIDNDGVVGVEDASLLMNDYQCVGDCVGDINGDQIVNVLDLLEFLTEFGRTDCLVEPALSIGVVTSVTELEGQLEPSTNGQASGKPVYYDMSGRVVPGPVENLASGIYIVKCNLETKKIFVQ